MPMAEGVDTKQMAEAIAETIEEGETLSERAIELVRERARGRAVL